MTNDQSSAWPAALDEIDRLRKQVAELECLLESSRSLASWTIGQTQQLAAAQAVVDAARQLEQFLTHDIGMDKPELTHVRWTLAAYDASVSNKQAVDTETEGRGGNERD